MYTRIIVSGIVKKPHEVVGCCCYSINGTRNLNRVIGSTYSDILLFAVQITYNQSALWSISAGYGNIDLTAFAHSIRSITDSSAKAPKAVYIDRTFKFTLCYAVL